MKRSKTADAPPGNEEVPALTEPKGSVPFSRKVNGKFTKEFKEAIIRRIEGGTPLRRVARVENLDPAMVRGWRDELRDLGPLAFLRTEGVRFTKDIKEAAVKRVEEGTPVKEVARDCRADPADVRRWRNAWRTLGPGAFINALRKGRPKVEPKPRFVIFRLSEDELNQLKTMAKAAGARSLADFARCRLLGEDTRHYNRHRPPRQQTEQSKQVDVGTRRHP